MVLTLAFNTFIFGVTVVQTYRHAMEMRKHGQTSVTEVLLRDGTPMYSLSVTSQHQQPVAQESFIFCKRPSYTGHV